MRSKSYKVFRWILRGLSGLLIVFFLFMFISDLLDSESSEPMSANNILLLSSMGIGLIGLGLAWKWELIGGIIALAGFVALILLNPTTLQSFSLPLYPVTAILFIVLWVLSRNTTVKNK